MQVVAAPGPIVVLQGPPRSGKSSIATALGDPWVNVGVDLFGRSVVPRRFRPGIGLRPGGERPDLEPLLPVLTAALFASAAVLDGLPVLLVGVRCPLEVVVRRRDAEPDRYVGSFPGGGIPDVVRRWDEAVHTPGVYDLEVDTSTLAPEACAAAVRHRLESGPPGTAVAVWARRSR